MMKNILSAFGFGTSASHVEQDSKRKHIRHADISADVIFGNTAYHIRDWSMGGVFFDALPEAPVTAGDTLNVTMRFNFPNDVIHVEHQVQVMRSARNGVAAEFAPLSKEKRRKFERVLDTLHAHEFLESQVA
jgi:hypothetical protein